MKIKNERVLVTRAPSSDNGVLDDALRRLGFIPEYLECVRYDVTEEIQAGLDDERQKFFRGYYDWLVLSSPRTVCFLNELGFLRQGNCVEALVECRIAAVGHATELAAERNGLRVSTVPSKAGKESSARGLLEVFPDKNNACPETGRVFLPGSTQAQPTLAEGLRLKGWMVRSYGIYKPNVIHIEGALGYEKLMAGYYDALLVTSGSAAKAFGQNLPEELSVYTLGKQTQDRLTACGIKNEVLTGVL